MRSAAFLAFLVLLGPVALAQGNFVRVDASSPRVAHDTPPGGAQTLSGPSVCSDTARAWEGQLLPGGGTLLPKAFMNSATVANGRIAFIAEVAGSTRNQGVFWADAAGVHEIARGSGGGGGSGVPGPAVGDPTPIGGRFTGFFQGTFFAPAINAGGDVLFMADVNGGSAVRGLFLYRAATQSILEVAAPGDPSPAGGTLAEVGPGTINDAGTVAFLANGLPSADAQILRWQAGVLTKIAEDGDPAPGGDHYAQLCQMSFGFVDGTTIPVGAVPDVNSAGNVVFGALTSVDWGFVLETPAGAAQWYVRQGEATPIGGVYLDFWSAILNDADQIAFLSDVDFGGGIYGGGWMVGKPGAWRKALAFDDTIEDAPVRVLGVSSNPQAPLANNGDLVAWCDAARECLVLSRANGTTEVLAGAGDATSLGGTIGVFDSWPSIDATGAVTMSCTTPGALNGVGSAHFVLDLCPRVPVQKHQLHEHPPETVHTHHPFTASRPGTLGNPGVFSQTSLPEVGRPWKTVVDGQGALATMLMISCTGPDQGKRIPAGELLIRAPFSTLLQPGTSHAIDIPNDLALAGVQFWSQGAALTRDGWQLTNALDVTIGHVDGH